MLYESWVSDDIFVDDEMLCLDIPGLVSREQKLEVDSLSTEDDEVNFCIPDWEIFNEEINGVFDHVMAVGSDKPGEVIRVMLDSGSTIHAAKIPEGIQNKEECPEKRFEMANGSLSGAP